MNPAHDRDRLAAFVDGELSPEEAAAVVRHLADHPADQAHVDDLFAANEALGQAFDAPLNEPIPDRIRAAIMGEAADAGATVVPFRRPVSRSAPIWIGLGLAASVAAVALVFGLPRGAAPQGLALGPVSDAALAAALDGTASGVPVALGDAGELMVLASFAMPDGRYCREVELIAPEADRIDFAVTCRAETGWQVAVAVSEAVAAGGDAGFVPASGDEVRALTLFLDAQGQAVPLDAAAEAAAIAAGWTQ